MADKNIKDVEQDSAITDVRIAQASLEGKFKIIIYFLLSIITLSLTTSFLSVKTSFKLDNLTEDFNTFKALQYSMAKKYKKRFPDEDPFPEPKKEKKIADTSSF